MRAYTTGVTDCCLPKEKGRQDVDLFNGLAGTACGIMLQTRRATIYYGVSEKPNFVILLIHA